MMSCTVRSLQSTPIHRDWLPGENASLEFSSNLQEQFAWNVYLKMPRSGGGTTIYKERDPAKVTNLTHSTKVTPSEGDLLIFRSTQAHAVAAGSGERLTLSGFFGVAADQLLFWV